MDYGEGIAAFLEKNPEIDAAFATNDVIASQIVRYCAKAGISVPGRLKVVGYDDIELAALYTPAITTIRQSVEDICRSAVESIVHRKEKTVPVNTVFPVTLVERETT
jgi:DNA-binding LacI/PurR family transcriptional regulator